MERLSRLIFEDMDLGKNNFPFRMDEITMSYIEIADDYWQYKDSVEIFFSQIKKDVTYRSNPKKKISYTSKMLLPSNIPEPWNSCLPDTLYFHTHPYCEITYFMSGSAIYISNRHFIEVGANDIIIFNSNIPHFWFPNPNNIPRIKVYNFYPSLLMLQNFNDNNYEFLSSLYSSRYPYHYLKQNEYKSSILIPLLRKMEKEFKAELPGYEIIIKAVLLEFTTELVRHIPELEPTFTLEKGGLNYLKKSIDYINENYSKHIYVEELAKIACMNTNYFSSCFKREMGISVINYINKLRIAKSAEMIVNTDLSLLEIGNLCGFSSPTAFYRAFKNTYNISPSQYRAAMKQAARTDYNSKL